MSHKINQTLISVIVASPGTHKQIATRLGVSAVTVGRYKAAAGITKAKNEHIEAAKVEAIRLLKSGMIRQRVAEVLKTQPATVGKWADDAGLPRARARKEKAPSKVAPWILKAMTEAAK